MKVLDTSGRVLRINAPEWYHLPAFVEMINRPVARVATFHDRGSPAGEYSDVFLPFEIFQSDFDAMGNSLWSGDGSDIFHADDLNSVAIDLIRVARECGILYGVAWISNLH